MIAPPSDVGGAEMTVRDAYGNLLDAMVGLYERALPGGSGNRRSTALALAALSAGGMVLARTISDTALGSEVREAALAKALDMLKPEAGVQGRVERQ